MVSKPSLDADEMSYRVLGLKTPSPGVLGNLIAGTFVSALQSENAIVPCLIPNPPRSKFRKSEMTQYGPVE